MSDSLPTVWELEPHTEAKHKILRGYLNAWLPILSRKLSSRTERVLYVDGFAGPGIYAGGEDGSPLIALRAALDHVAKFQNKVRLVFIEIDEERHRSLASIIDGMSPEIAAKENIEVPRPFHGNCAEIIEDVLDKYERKKRPFGPALIFLDQFGYSDVPLSLISRIMEHERCEVFSYLHADGIRRFINDSSKHSAIDRAFGDPSWRDALQGARGNLLNRLAEKYRAQLKEKANSRYVWHFAMHGQGDKLLYWLFFCTNSLRGLEVMKRAMQAVDQSGGAFRFSDSHDPNQILLFNSFSSTNLEDSIYQEFAGKTVPVLEIAEFVLEQTPAVLYKDALGQLEEKDFLTPVNPPPKRRRKSFPDENMLISFRAQKE
jgi:three-Cys-motif partner protein